MPAASLLHASTFLNPASGSAPHQLALRSEILNAMSEFSEQDIQGKAGREKLAAALREAINKKLIDLEDFGGVQEVHFTSFVLQ